MELSEANWAYVVSRDVDYRDVELEQSYEHVMDFLLPLSPPKT